MSTWQFFQTVDGTNHNIDSSGNHFINGKLVNPSKYMEGGLENPDLIGSTHPKRGKRISLSDRIESFSDWCKFQSFDQFISNLKTHTK